MKTTGIKKGGLLLIAACMVGITGAYAGKDVSFKLESNKISKEAPVLDKDLKFQKNEEYEPVFFIKDNVLYVSYLNFDSKDVNFKFKDKDYFNTVIFRYSSADKKLQKAFALDKLDNGRYTVVVTIEDIDYTYEFTKG